MTRPRLKPVSANVPAHSDAPAKGLSNPASCVAARAMYCKMSHAIPRTLIVALLLCPTVAVTQQAPAQPNIVEQYTAAQIAADANNNWLADETTGRLIVKYRSAEKPWQTPRGSKRVVRKTLRDNLQLSLERELTDTQELVKTKTGQNLAQLKAQARVLNAQSNVEYASIEYRRYPLLQPNDPLYLESQGIGDQSYLYQGEYSLHTPGAWDITTGSANSVIAIVDTGVLPEHPEIKDRSVATLGYDFVSADSPGDFFSANDGDGRDANPTDPGDGCNGGSSSWHGTSVASVAAGTANNAEGLAGIDWNARLLHARALGICGGTDADIIDAIRWSAGLPVVGLPLNPTPANVVNLSLGGPTECTRAWQDVIDELAERNVVFVMAAGNEAQNALRSAPANCANVITVGSSTPSGSVDNGFSNYGVKVTVSTAGRDILAASNRGFDDANPDGHFYTSEIGTSFSAALVSGAISLMHSLDPDLGPPGVRAILQQSATPYAAGSNCDLYHCGGGIMNLARALSTVRDNNYDPQVDTAQQLIDNQSTEVSLPGEVDAELFGYKDVRYFSVTVSESGLLQAESTSNEDLYGYLLNSELSVIALDDDSGASTNFRIASLVEPGNYYIAIERERHRLNDGEAPFTLQTLLSRDAPDAFSFTQVSNALARDVVLSNVVTISGLQGESVVTISDGFYSINDGLLTNAAATIRNGDTVQVATQSPGSAGGSTTATVTVGAFSTDFIVITEAGDSARDSGDDINFNTGSSETIDTDNDVSTASSGCSIAKTGSAALDPLFLLMLVTMSAALLRRRSSTSLSVVAQAPHVGNTSA